MVEYNVEFVYRKCLLANLFDMQYMELCVFDSPFLFREYKLINAHIVLCVVMYGYCD